MSDMFFIIASVSVVILTILLSIALLKLISSLDEVNIVVGRANNISEKVETMASNAAEALTTVAGAAAVLSPVAGLAKGVFGFGRRRKNKSRS